MFLKQSTAVNIPLGPFPDSTDGNTEEVGLTIVQADVKLKKFGGTYAQKNETSNSAHDANGEYVCALDATDTNTVGPMRVLCHPTGALIYFKDYFVVPANVYMALIGTDKLDVAATEITAGLITAEAIATGAIDSDALAANALTAIFSAVVASAMGEGYSTKGSAFSLQQAIYDIHQFLYDCKFLSTVGTIYARNGTSTGKTVTIDDATTPTRIIEAT